jgi:hypothetical protein
MVFSRRSASFLCKILPQAANVSAVSIVRRLPDFPPLAQPRRV